MTTIASLPTGSAPTPVPIPHFPSVLHAVVWRNWDVIAVENLARILEATSQQIKDLAYAMGLPPQRAITDQEVRRNYMTILHRNWHLLPYEQLCPLLGWDAVKMQFSLNEDDFMYIKLGGYKPACPPVFYREADAKNFEGTNWIAETVRAELGADLVAPAEPLFGFIDRFQKTFSQSFANPEPALKFCMVYPYFLRFGDPLEGEGIEDIPESYLAELAASGVNAIWLQGVLNTLAPWDYAPELSRGWEERIANLNLLVKRCGTFGIKVLIYLNEPRSMPRSFFEKYPDLRGVEETPDRAPYSPDVVALCVSSPAVQDFLVNSVRHVFEQVPDLGGILAITFSENLTNCYSREYDPNVVDEFALRATTGEGSPQTELKPCPRCAARGAEVVNAEVCTLLERGMRQAGSDGKFLLYTWSTPERWIPGIVERLPESTWVLCVSEWAMPFTRGDYSGKVNEYSISVIGPSQQSLQRWEIARQRGLRTAAKMQAANTFEISSIPYIPALRRVAQHLSNVTSSGVEGIMLGWTAGGSPSPNLDLVAEFSRNPRPSVEEALRTVAVSRFGAEAAPQVIEAWDLLSDAYEEFPFDMTVCYFAPQSLGPANLLFATSTRLLATMVTFPFDDLEGWRGPYSKETLLSQFEKLAERWEKGVEVLAALRQTQPSQAIEDEWRIAEACRIHFRSTVNQIRYIRLRESKSAEVKAILLDEIILSRRLYDLVSCDSRIGFEATNQYGYIAYDLIEKILNCRQLLSALEAENLVQIS